MPTRAKRLEYSVRLDRAGRSAAEDAPPVEFGREWTPEHLLLAGLARCTVASLRYHARRLGGDAVAEASARGHVTQRDSDGRYAFVEIDCSIDVEVEHPAGDVSTLLALAERDCFVGASLTVSPRYTWHVNGEPASPTPPAAPS